MAPRHELSDRKDRISALGLVAPPPIHVQSPTFDGSLATLFSCVRDHKVDLLDIPLFPICEAYFAYLMLSQLPDLDEAAAALTALAYLLERKAWLLLPSPEEEPEFEEPMELPDPTAYEYQAAIEALRVWQQERSELFFRSSEAGPDPYELPYTLGEVAIRDLATAFERVLRNAKPEAPNPINKTRKSLQEQMRLALQRITSEWESLEDLIDPPYTRSDAVYWFLAILELIRIGQIAVKVFGQEVKFALRKSDAHPHVIQPGHTEELAAGVVSQ